MGAGDVLFRPGVRRLAQENFVRTYLFEARILIHYLYMFNYRVCSHLIWQRKSAHRHYHHPTECENYVYVKCGSVAKPKFYGSRCHSTPLLKL